MLYHDSRFIPGWVTTVCDVPPSTLLCLPITHLIIDGLSKLLLFLTRELKPTLHLVRKKWAYLKTHAYLNYAFNFVDINIIFPHTRFSFFFFFFDADNSFLRFSTKNPFSRAPVNEAVFSGGPTVRVAPKWKFEFLGGCKKLKQSNVETLNKPKGKRVIKIFCVLQYPNKQGGKKIFSQRWQKAKYGPAC